MDYKPGTLFVVATPIGNLQDITYRAVEILKSVSYILSENPLTTQKLLTTYHLSVRVSSYREDNHDRVMSTIIKDLKEGRSLALVTEAGTPGVSDPGSKLMRNCYQEHIPVIPIPGPSALATAMSVFPLPSAKVLFWGFAPRKQGEWQKLFDQQKELMTKEKMSLIFYESPFRMKKSLALLTELSAIFKDEYTLMVGIGKEMTKMFEAYRWGTPEELLKQESKEFKLDKGEFTVVVCVEKVDARYQRSEVKE